MNEQNTRKPYPTDLTDAQWKLVEPHLPQRKSPRGRNRVHSFREILNAIFYLLRTGCAWRLLPHDLPRGRPCIITSAYGSRRAHGSASTRRFGQSCGLPAVGDCGQPVGEEDRKRGSRGYDAGKKVKGRKGHLLVDTLGLLLTVVVHAADIQDRDGAKLVLEKVRGRLPRLRLIWADGAYAGQLVGWVERVCGWVLAIIARPSCEGGFVVLPRRWVVERTFAWLFKYRRLSKDYEALPETSEALIYAAMVHVMVRRLARIRARSP